MKLDELRANIDEIDAKMMTLFAERMVLSQKIAQYKKENNLPVLDVKREQIILEARKKALNDETLWPYYEKFIKQVMMLSKEIQK